MDTKQEFIEAVHMGREIEFSCCGQHYFESRTHDKDWYLYHEETKQAQHFSSAQQLLEEAVLLDHNLSDSWMKITIDCIL